MNGTKRLARGRRGLSMGCMDESCRFTVRFCPKPDGCGRKMIALVPAKPIGLSSYLSLFGFCFAAKLALPSNGFQDQSPIYRSATFADTCDSGCLKCSDPCTRLLPHRT